MRAPGSVVVACLVLTLAGAASSGAAVAEKEPVTGGLMNVPGAKSAPAAAATPSAAETSSPPAAAAPAPATAEPTGALETEADRSGATPEAHTSWGVVARGGYFGLPDAIADKLFRQHPKVDGYTYGAELRYHGDGGGRGVTSIGFAFDYARTEGDGIWQPDAEDAPEAFSGKIEMYAFSVTGYWSMFPSWYVHPYVGLGLGAASLKGDYFKDNERTTVDAWAPVVHVPVGFAFEFGEHFQFSLEARFLDGIAAGGALQARF